LISEIIGSTKNFKLSLGKNKGYVNIVSEELPEINKDVEFELNAIKLENKDGWFSESDPFLEISRIKEDKSIILV
jgi:basic membrane lipoprotein Med (substrate-binding protein (PBP1-ABC) superfamily)